MRVQLLSSAPYSHRHSGHRQGTPERKSCARGVRLIGQGSDLLSRRCAFESHAPYQSNFRGFLYSCPARAGFMMLHEALRSAGLESEAAPPTIAQLIRRPWPRERLMNYWEESAFSRNHAKLSTDEQCWLCLFPILNTKSNRADLRKSSDHVIPRSRGGGSSSENLRVSHAWCNSYRKNDEVTPDLVRICRQRMLQKYLGWLLTVNVDRRFGLRDDIYKPEYDHSGIFKCKCGAD